jgi:membrane fusion protein (multidrug efflux system)
MSKSSIVVFVAAALIVGAAAGFYGPGLLNRMQPAPVAPKVAAAPAPVAKPVEVHATKVVLAAFPRGVAAVGSLRADESVTIRPEIAGRIVEIRFTEGQRVQKGQVLIRLDDSITRAELAQVRANHTLAKSKFDRATELQQKGFISKQARDDADNVMRVQEAAMDLAQARLDKSTLRAPFSGVIGLRNVSVGNYVQEGSEIVTIQAIDPLKVDFRIPELYMSDVRQGQTLEITLDAMPDKRYEGKVFAISPLIDEGGRAIVMRAQVNNRGGDLRPGMFARVRLLFGATQPSPTVQETALVPQRDEQYVFVVRDNRAQQVKVEIGQRRDGMVEVLAGLKEGDMVVTAGHQKIRDGLAVTVMNPVASR